MSKVLVFIVCTALTLACQSAVRRASASAPLDVPSVEELQAAFEADADTPGKFGKWQRLLQRIYVRPEYAPSELRQKVLDAQACVVSNLLSLVYLQGSNDWYSISNRIPLGCASHYSDCSHYSYVEASTNLLMSIADHLGTTWYLPMDRREAEIAAAVEEDRQDRLARDPNWFRGGIVGYGPKTVARMNEYAWRESYNRVISDTRQTTLESFFLALRDRFCAYSEERRRELWEEFARRAHATSGELQKIGPWPTSSGQ